MGWNRMGQRHYGLLAPAPGGSEMIDPISAIYGALVAALWIAAAVAVRKASEIVGAKNRIDAVPLRLLARGPPPDVAVFRHVSGGNFYVFLIPIFSIGV